MGFFLSVETCRKHFIYRYSRFIFIVINLGHASGSAEMAVSTGKRDHVYFI